MSGFMVPLTMFVAWIGICGMAILAGFVLKDEILSIVIGMGLMLICAFGFGGYFIGKARERELSKLEEEA